MFSNKLVLGALCAGVWVTGVLVACSGDGTTDGSGASGSTSSSNGSTGSGPGGCSVQGQSCQVLCDADLGCVDCLDDGDCGVAAPHCVYGRCRECEVNADCPMGSSCQPESGQCAQSCQTNGDCGQNNNDICDPMTGACVECLTPMDCQQDQPFCLADTKSCAECEKDADCGVAQPQCDLPSGNCVACIVDADCGAGQACNNDNECVSHCTANSDCTEPGQPLCNVPSGQCVECLANTDCGVAAPVCAQNHRCVVCVQNTDCPAATPFCDQNGGNDNQCVECLEDNDCTMPGAGNCNNNQCVP